MKRKYTVLAKTVAVILLAAIFFTLAVISIEARHDCAGEDCPVCAVLAFCRDVLSLCALAAFAPLPFLRASCDKAAEVFSRVAPAHFTPVKLKVKLSN